MSIYPDTTFYVALRFYADVHHEAALSFWDAHTDDTFLWSPWHRVEVINTLRQLTRGDRPMLREGDARRVIHQLENDVRLGYLLHMEADWRDVLRSAYDISSARGFSFTCRSADLLHIAYAREFAVDLFASFDRDQTKLASAIGINVEDAL